MPRASEVGRKRAHPTGPTAEFAGLSASAKMGARVPQVGMISRRQQQRRAKGRALSAQPGEQPGAVSGEGAFTRSGEQDRWSQPRGQKEVGSAPGPACTGEGCAERGTESGAWWDPWVAFKQGMENTRVLFGGE